VADGECALTCRSTRTRNIRRPLRGKLLRAGHLYVKVVKDLTLPKSLTGIDEHVGDIARVRAATKAARFKPLPHGVETVDEVVSAALRFLEDRLGPTYGFKLARSQLSLNRRQDDMTQSIQLRLGSGNLSGVSVEVSAYALVRSSKFKAWCATEGTGYSRDLLWTRQVGYLGGANQYFKWQLGDAGTRERELEDLLGTISAKALPALDSWVTKGAIASSVFRGTEVERIDWLMEIALWAMAPSSAERLLAAYIESSPELAAEFHIELARFNSDASVRPSPHALSGAAYLVARHNLRIGK